MKVKKDATNNHTRKIDVTGLFTQTEMSVHTYF